jgi:branched-chain amino acid transport system permease protein
MNFGLFVQCLANGIMIGGMYALVASGFTLVLGVMKIFNFAQGQFYMLGAFVTFGVCGWLGLPYIIGLIASLLAMALLGLFLQSVIVRYTYSGFFHTVLATLAFGTIITQGSLLTFGYREQFMPAVIKGRLVIGSVVIPADRLMIIGISIATLVALYFLMKLRIGKAMRAVAENQEVAALQGINTKSVFLVTMGWGCGLAGLAGGLIAPIQCASVEMGNHIFIMVLLVICVGGMGSMLGALLAAFLIGIVESFGYQFIGEFNVLFIFICLAPLLYFRPGGLLGKPLAIPGEE